MLPIFSVTAEINLPKFRLLFRWTDELDLSNSMAEGVAVPFLQSSTQKNKSMVNKDRAIVAPYADHHIQEICFTWGRGARTPRAREARDLQVRCRSQV